MSLMFTQNGKESLRLKRAREPLISEVDKSEELSSKLQKLDERFDFNVTSDDFTCFMEGETPANTETSTMQAVKIFDDWRRTSESQLAGVSNVISNHNTPAFANKSCASGGAPTIVLKGCTFTGCSVAFSGPSSNVNNESVAAEVLQGLTVEDIFDDCQELWFSQGVF